MPSLNNFDRFCAEHYPEADTLSEEIVLKWLEIQLAKKHSNIGEKATTVRLLGRYLDAMGEEAYILPSKYATQRKPASEPYIFTDAELRRLFTAADNIHTWKSELHVSVIIPVILYIVSVNGGKEKAAAG